MENKYKKAKIDKFINSPHISEFLRDYKFSAGDILTLAIPANKYEISYPVSGFTYIFWDVFVATDTCNHIYPYLSKYAIRKMMPQEFEWISAKNPLLESAKRMTVLENYLLQDDALNFCKISDTADQLEPDKVLVNYAKVVCARNFEMLTSPVLRKIALPKHFEWPDGDVYSWVAEVVDKAGRRFVIICLLESGLMKIVPAQDVVFIGNAVDLPSTHFLRTNLFYFKVCHEQGNRLI